MATATKSHEPIPYAKIAKLYEEGKSYEVIAQKVNRYNEKNPDPTKSVRAIVSRMITDGFTGEAGKTIKLKKRAGSRGTKGTAKVAKAAKSTKVAKSTKQAKPAKAIAIMLTSDGKHIKLTVPSLITMIPVSTFENKVNEVLNQASAKAVASAKNEEVLAEAPAVEVAKPETMVSEQPAEVVSEQPAEVETQNTQELEQVDVGMLAETAPELDANA